MQKLFSRFRFAGRLSVALDDRPPKRPGEFHRLAAADGLGCQRHTLSPQPGRVSRISMKPRAIRCGCWSCCRHAASHSFSTITMPLAASAAAAMSLAECTTPLDNTVKSDASSPNDSRRFTSSEPFTA